MHRAAIVLNILLYIDISFLLFSYENYRRLSYIIVGSARKYIYMQLLLESENIKTITNLTI